MNCTTPTRQPRAQPRPITPNAAELLPFPAPVFTRRIDAARAMVGWYEPDRRGGPVAEPKLVGGLMVCGTTSDAGKSTVVTGLGRALARRGVRVAPFKAQNMALNSYVTPDGGEIGRAQGVQALAAGIQPDVAMNPILLKPTGERASQVIVRGRPVAVMTAAEYHDAKPGLLPTALSALADLRARFDVVLCERAGS